MSAFGGAVSLGSLGVLVVALGIPYLFFESLRLAPVRCPSAFGSRLERPG